ncbi:MAG: tyrosine--tRNA ligase [Candidatus Marsarchaeota archaeon]|nr:tyrosine--tRNA ligase [Candidatus Marsarchaeota archaeon]
MDVITNLKKREVIEQIIIEKDLVNLLRSDKRLTVYSGIDPTAKELHIGHITPLMVLKSFQQAGHKVILLIGDQTAMIGDPTDKAKTRKKLTREQVIENLSTYHNQIINIFDFKDNPIEIKQNSEWFGHMNTEMIMNLASNVTVQRIAERDMFQKRKAEKRPVFLHEFFYPVMQGYDSVALQADVEIGGRDQLFNMLVGRDFVRKFLGKDKHCITTPILLGTDGRKMGKTEGNSINISCDALSIFVNITQINDTIIPVYLKRFTNVDNTVIEKVEERLVRKENMIEDRKILAYEIVKLLRGEKEANSAKETFEMTIQKGIVAKEPQKIDLNTLGERRLLKVLHKIGLIQSMSDGRRLVVSGAIQIDGTKITNFDLELNSECVNDGSIIKVGKRGAIKIRY